MKKDHTILLKGSHIILQQLHPEDTDAYFQAGFMEEDRDMMRLTGNERMFTKTEIQEYVTRIYDDETRYDFLIKEVDTILGEIVLNGIDWSSRNCGFRIALFHPSNCSRGIGSEAISLLLSFAFETLRLHRIELEVFDYNLRAKHTYEKMGFQVEGILRDALFFENAYHNIYAMSILQADYVAQLNDAKEKQ